MIRELNIKLELTRELTQQEIDTIKSYLKGFTEKPHTIKITETLMVKC